MTNEAVVEQTLKQSQKPANWLTHYEWVFPRLEIALWVVFVIIRTLQKERLAYTEEVAILVLITIAMLYSLVPLLVFGSQGWKRHVGSYLVGMTTSSTVMAYLFVIKKSSFASEIATVFLLPCLAGTLITFIFMCLNFRWNPGDRFYIFILLRLLICTMIVIVTTDFMP